MTFNTYLNENLIFIMLRNHIYKGTVNSMRLHFTFSNTPKKRGENLDLLLKYKS